MIPIGIMQGRLSPPLHGRIQAFPVKTWREEFELAKKGGLYCIEWIYDATGEHANPLRTEEGLREVERSIEDSGVKVLSICADYYMTETLLDGHGNARPKNVRHLEWLLGRASALGVRYVVLPLVDSSSLATDRAIETLLAIVRSLGATVRKARVELHLETDLAPRSLVELLERIDEPLVRANYDTGNSASLGRDPQQELALLGSWLGSVHIKDRLLGGGTVPLGTGSADLAACFRLILAAGFPGPCILQAAREGGISELGLAIRNRRLVEKLILEARQAPALGPRA